MKSEIDEDESAIDIIQKFAEYHNTEEGEYWWALIELDKYHDQMTPRLSNALTKEIEGLADCIQGRYKLKEVTKIREFFETYYEVIDKNE